MFIKPLECCVRDSLFLECAEGQGWAETEVRGPGGELYHSSCREEIGSAMGSSNREGNIWIYMRTLVTRWLRRIGACVRNKKAGSCFFCSPGPEWRGSLLLQIKNQFEGRDSELTLEMWGLGLLCEMQLRFGQRYLTEKSSEGPWCLKPWEWKVLP